MLLQEKTNEFGVPGLSVLHVGGCTWMRDGKMIPTYV